jgi:DNA (cytosine-5)-methyltransferase 1
VRTLDLFAGAGGWDVAAHRLGLDVDRVELWETANATAEAAGLHTVHHDVTTFTTTPDEYTVHLGSPSCKRYSMAGNGAGRKALGQVLAGVEAYRRGGTLTHDQAVDLIGDADAALTLEPLRLALQGRPTYLAWEQTPAALPVWNACADVLREQGYSVVTGILNAEQYGVPQTRRRAVVMARRDGRAAGLPAVTHSQYHVRDPNRLDAGVKPWVCMAEAIGWSGRDTTWAYRGGAAAHSAVRPLNTPAPVMAFGHNVARHQWVKGGQGKRIRDTEAGYEQTVRLTTEQAARLQTFPAGYPFQGSNREVFQQIGNAVPPLLAEVVLGALTG